MKAFKIYFLSNFQIYSTVLLTIVSMLYITCCDIYFITESYTFYFSLTILLSLTPCLLVIFNLFSVCISSVSFLSERLLIIDSISLTQNIFTIKLFIFVWAWVICIFQRIGLFCLDYQIYRHTVVFGIPLESFKNNRAWIFEKIWPWTTTQIKFQTKGEKNKWRISRDSKERLHGSWNINLALKIG